MIYYRLQQVDKNGATAYSSIVKINLDDLLPGVTVYPNPVRDIIKLKLTTTAEKWSVTIFDANGKQAGSHIINAAPQIDIRVSHLAAGTYSSLLFSLFCILSSIFYLLSSLLNFPSSID